MLTLEREVEMHFASPLFRELGYSEDQEAAGFPFDLWEGVLHHAAEADLLYFADDKRELSKAQPLVLVECKSPAKDGPDVGIGQVKSYAFWVKPAYYVTTNGNMLTVRNYQGGAVPDVRVLEVRRRRVCDIRRVTVGNAAWSSRLTGRAAMSGSALSAPEEPGLGLRAHRPLRFRSCSARAHPRGASSRAPRPVSSTRGSVPRRDRRSGQRGNV